MGITEGRSAKIYETYRKAGGNFIDTANFYTNGTSERFVGEFIHSHRESVVLATKYSNAAPGSGSQSETIADRLHRLVLGAHLGWDHTSGRSHARSGRYRSPRQGSLRRHLGRSRLVDRAGKYSGRASRLDTVHWVQIEYSLMERTVERELIPMAKALNLGVLAWSPLARGVLTGKYHGEGKADGGRMTNEGLKAFLPEEQRAAPIISAVKSVAEQTGRSMARVALAWLRHQTVPVIPIIGARRASQLQDNLASLDLELSAEQLKSLDGASRIDLGFPQSIYEKESVRAVRYAGVWDRLLV
jgi:aryl-alcohol dehydrogenase-like predicted oxidoreductase